MTDRVTETQVLVIGGGIIGTAIARELSKYKVDVCLVDKNPGIGLGITKSGQGLIHGGLGLSGSKLVKWWDRSGDIVEYLNKPLANKERLNIIGHKMYHEELESTLGIRVRRIGRIMVTDNKDEIRVLEAIKQVAESRGFKDLLLLDGNQLLSLEPAIDTRFIAALYDPSESIIMATEVAVAFAENAKENGTKILLRTEVRGIEEKDGYHLINTNNGTIKTDYVVNAAGLFSDEIAAMIDKIDFSFTLMKTQEMIIENKGYLNHMVSEVFKPVEPRGLMPTPDNNILVAAVISIGKDKYDLSNTKEALDRLYTYPQLFIPSIDTVNDMIRAYVGYMHTDSREPDDYVIEWSRDKFLNLVTCAPGCGPAPALAVEVTEMLGEHGLNLVPKSDWNPYRYHRPRIIEMSPEDRNRQIAIEPRHGHIVCRCEKATEQEIRDAIRSGAQTLEAVKFATRATMGRCQGGFCTSRILKIMAEELSTSPLDIKQGGANSYILKRETKTPAETKGVGA